jgi:hypothetical protein
MYSINAIAFLRLALAISSRFSIANPTGLKYPPGVIDVLFV